MQGAKRLTTAVAVALVSVAAALSQQPAAQAQTTACAAWMDATKSPDARAHALLAKMSLDDKLQMVSQNAPIWAHYGAAGYIAGNPALCIPDLVLNDAGQGVGDHNFNVTAFPSGIAQASSWDRTLQRKFGKALGHEAWLKGINVQLAPDINIARFPMNGRNSEAFGEDPYLTGQTGVAEVRGIQDNPVIATVKHYALNNHEVNRMTVSADADDRTIHEIYTPAFEAAVKQGQTGAVMSSYNRINGTYASENGPMLNGILKTEFGFDGFVMSDWGGQHSTVEGALGGGDMEMGFAPRQYYGDPLKQAVQEGKVPQARLDDMVLRILRPMFREGIFEHPAGEQPAAYTANVETPEDVALARKVAEEGTVLLKNTDNALPIAGQGKRIAVIGPTAGQAGAEESYDTGGSAHIPEAAAHPHVISPLQGITQRASADNDVVTYADGNSNADAIAAASAADIAVVFVGDGETEGQDRPSLKLSDSKFCTLAGCAQVSTDQDALIKAVAGANPSTVVVLNTGGPMLMPWVADVKGIVQAWYPGQEDGNAIASLLFGDVNPSAKLVQTFPKAMADLPIKNQSQYPGVNDAQGVPHAAYSEGLKVGYRWYESQGIEPLFPFGFGLSYTTFKVSGVKVKGIVGGAAGALVGASVKNTGPRAGAEVAQLYVGMPAETGEPPKQLKSYRKVQLQPGQTKNVTMKLGRRAFSQWSPGSGWVIAKGCYRLMLGTSSRDIAATKVVSVAGAKCPGAAAHLGRPVQKCVDSRRFAFKLHHAVGARIVRVAVYVNGKRRLSLRGKDIKRVSIARLPRKRFTVKIVTTSSTGAKLISTRVYHGCKKTRPRTHRGR
jgi:beta-glucosidase